MGSEWMGLKEVKIFGVTNVPKAQDKIDVKQIIKLETFMVKPVDWKWCLGESKSNKVKLDFGGIYFCFARGNKFPVTS